MSAPSPEPQSEDRSPSKPLLEHLEDLRWVLLKSLSVLLIACVGCFFFAPKIIDFLQYPLKKSGVEDPTKVLKALGPMDPFAIAFDAALYAGAIIATPFLVYIIASYLLPALTQRERRAITPVLFLSSFFFLAGVFFCYFFVLPPSLRVAREFAAWLHINADFWTISSYVGFVTKFMLGMGIAFELPLAILILLRLGILDYSMLTKARPYVVVGILILASALSPGTDVFSMLLMAIPLLVMFEACIWIAWFKRAE